MSSPIAPDPSQVLQCPGLSVPIEAITATLLLVLRMDLPVCLLTLLSVAAANITMLVIEKVGEPVAAELAAAVSRQPRERQGPRLATRQLTKAPTSTRSIRLPGDTAVNLAPLRVVVRAIRRLLPATSLRQARRGIRRTTPALLDMSTAVALQSALQPRMSRLIRRPANLARTRTIAVLLITIPVGLTPRPATVETRKIQRISFVTTIPTRMRARFIRLVRTMVTERQLRSSFQKRIARLPRRRLLSTRTIPALPLECPSSRVILMFLLRNRPVRSVSTSTSLR
mmetsp:Transcript_18281/g.52311  ORF Transcript_18281/g.52311 Transcript_18281/m.52311 type:complete len:284 (-) Transcript_18281:4686-5537(-)